MSLIALMTLAACGGSTVAPEPAAMEVPLSPQAPENTDPSASEDPLPEAIQPGAVVASVTPLAGEAVTLPDPEGRYVILELIRSADW